MTTRGLQRFVAPRTATHRPLPPPLRRAEAPPARAPGEACEMCNEPLLEEHSHVVNLENRALLCTCRPCYLLFTRPGAAGGKYVSVPDRRLYDPDFTLGDAQWEQLQIPVRMAFFFVNSQLDKTVAFYPSPAGATESLLPLDTWNDVMTANPLLPALTPDIEALIMFRGDDRYECHLVPIDACYELVGLVRKHWKGFDGGQEAWEAIDSFFAGLRARAKPVRKTEPQP